MKSKNAFYLWSFIGIHLAIFLSLYIGKQFTGSSIDQFWNSVTSKGGIIATFIPVSAIVLIGLLGDLGKAHLVFWRWRDPLPGCRVFTDLMSTDPRIDAEILKDKHGELPHAPKAQNALWYQIYKKHKESMIIIESQKIYLLTRDMTAVSAIFAVLFSIGIFIDSVSLKIATFYSVALITQYLAIATSARNYGKRFVLNVLAEESHSK